MSTIYKATGDSCAAWGSTPAAAVAALENLLPARRLSTDCLVEAITDTPPPHSLEVTFVWPKSKRR
jgi:hypothetical protein